jgi:ketol-acid reductoisomerase
MAKMYYEADADPALITRRKVAVIGFGAHLAPVQHLMQDSRSWTLGPRPIGPMSS